MLVVGSYALNYVGRGRRPPQDIDIIGLESDLEEIQRKYDCTPIDGKAFRLPSGVIIDFEVATPGTSSMRYLELVLKPSAASYAIRTIIPELGMQVAWIASEEILFSLKRSHRHSPKAWFKHIYDYHSLKASLNQFDTYEDRLKDITQLREREMKAIKTPSLDKSAREFFDDSVSNRHFIHDQIHEVMAYGERPMFEQIRKSPDTVACDKSKWEALGETNQILCVLEEAYVIALERAILPMIYQGGPPATPKQALEWALMRICTTLCSGWFRDFATENYFQIKKAADWGYHQKFFAAVDAGRITRVAA